MLLPVLIALAALMGASGVILAAISAHLAPGAGLDSAAYMLLFHAVAVLSSAAVSRQRLVLRQLAGAALTAWVLGAALFAGDIATRALAGHRLFPLAAPTGGTLLVLGWIALAAAAVASLTKR
ncbi:MAG TPA: DUF423 domain-containing protein [Xanthobacteraceae bacterium]|jgi:uncharacterized membrane protein YgdD (TMEM256/DUF423 family)|nr:DUF423 domain-containing protein [Xanthobacteraceae bacterium]